LYEASHGLEYLDMVVQEALRMYPPLPKYVSMSESHTMYVCAYVVHTFDVYGLKSLLVNWIKTYSTTATFNSDLVLCFLNSCSLYIDEVSISSTLFGSHV